MLIKCCFNLFFLNIQKCSYEKSSRFGKLGYEDDFERFLRSLLSDVEKKIKRGNERLKLTQSEANGGVR